MDVESLTTFVRGCANGSLVIKVGHLSFDLGVTINTADTIRPMIMNQIISIVLCVHLRKAALLGVMALVLWLMVVIYLLIEIELLTVGVGAVLVRHRMVRNNSVVVCPSGIIGVSLPLWWYIWSIVAFF